MSMMMRRLTVKKTGRLRCDLSLFLLVGLLIGDFSPSKGEFWSVCVCVRTCVGGDLDIRRSVCSRVCAHARVRGEEGG